MELDAWFAMQIDLAEAPEDWTGPLDRLETEESDSALSADRTRRPLGTPLDDIASAAQAASESEDPDDVFDARR